MNVAVAQTRAGQRHPSTCPWLSDVPAHWTECRLSLVARLGSGHTPSRTRAEWWEDCTIPWITTGEVAQMRDDRIEYISSTREMISEAGVKNSSAVVHPAGTVVLSRTASAGFSAIMKTDMATSQDFVTWTCDPTLNPRYLLLCLRAMRSDLLGRLAMGSTHKTIYVPDIEAIRIPLPPLDEQAMIVEQVWEALSRIDALIDIKQQMIESVRQVVRSSTESEVLGHRWETRASGSSFLQWVPAHWGETVLRHLDCEVQTGPFGSQLHSAEYVQAGWPVVNPANLRDGRIVAIPEMAVSDEKRDELARHVLRPGDIVFGRRGEMGRAGLVTTAEEGWVCGTGSLRLRLSDDRLVPEYLKLVLETSALNAYFRLNSIGSTMDNLNSDIVLGAPIVVPPVRVQRYVVDQVRELRAGMDDLSDTLVRQIELLRERRQALTTAAVSGEMDVP